MGILNRSQSRKSGCLSSCFLYSKLNSWCTTITYKPEEAAFLYLASYSNSLLLWQGEATCCLPPWLRDIQEDSFIAKGSCTVSHKGSQLCVLDSYPGWLIAHRQLVHCLLKSKWTALKKDRPIVSCRVKTKYQSCDCLTFSPDI